MTTNPPVLWELSPVQKARRELKSIFSLPDDQLGRYADQLVCLAADIHLILGHVRRAA